MKRPCDYVYEWMGDMRIPLEKAKTYLGGDYKPFMNGDMRIDEALAEKIEHFTNLPKEKWLHIQKQYDDYLAKEANEAARPFL